jgi:hypothetical protein
MARRMNWLSGLPLCHTDLKEQDVLNHEYGYMLITNAYPYAYGIGKLTVNRAALLQGILHISEISCTFLGGPVVYDATGLSLNIGSIYKNTSVPIYIKPNNTVVSRHISDIGILNTHSGLLIGHIDIQGGDMYLTAHGCYCDVQANYSFILNVKGLLNRVSEALSVHQYHVLTFSGDEYSRALFDLLSIKQLVSDLTLISCHSVHPFYAYSLLRRYVSGCTIQYDHTDGIGVLNCLLHAVDSVYSLPGRKYVIDRINDYYEIPMGDGGVQLLITPYSDEVFLWLQNVHIASVSQMPDLERKRHKGLPRRVSIRRGHILLDIMRDNNYTENNMIVMECNDQITAIYLMQ